MKRRRAHEEPRQPRQPNSERAKEAPRATEALDRRCWLHNSRRPDRFSRFPFPARCRQPRRFIRCKRNSQIIKAMPHRRRNQPEPNPGPYTTYA